MRRVSLFTEKSWEIRYAFLIFIMLFGFTGCDWFDNLFKDPTKVTVQISPQELHQGDTANVDATLTKGPPNNTPIPNHRSIKFDLDVTTAGGLNTMTKATDTQGVAKVVFTAGKVDVDTPVTITATSRNGSGSSQNGILTVKPPIIFGDFGGDGPGISISNADVTITPSVKEPETNEYHFTYIVSSSATPNTAIDHLVLTFAVPMESVTASATVINRGNNIYSIGVVLNNPVTITAICKDCKTGGTTDFLIFDNPLPTTPTDPTPKLIRKNVIGPTHN
jgi:hypothetical protein